MKKAFVFIIGVMFFGACSDPGGNNPPPLTGSITFINFPDGGSSGCEVNTNSNYQWTVDWNSQLGYSYGTGDDWDQNIIGKSGNISFNGSDVSVEILDKNDFVFTGNASVYVKYFYCFNNVYFSNGHATVDYNDRYLAFQLPDTNGKFTLTNASDYNNKYVVLFGTFGNVSSPAALYGFDDAVSVTSFKGFKIENGEVEIPLYQITYGDNKFTAFTHTGDVISIVLIILDNEDFDYTHYAANSLSYKYLLYSTTTSNGVSFNNGVGNADAANGTKYPLTGW